MKGHTIIAKGYTAVLSGRTIVLKDRAVMLKGLLVIMVPGNSGGERSATHSHASQSGPYYHERWLRQMICAFDTPCVASVLTPSSRWLTPPSGSNYLA